MTRELHAEGRWVPGAFDPEELRQKYRDERDERLRPDGKAQYLPHPGPCRPTFLPARPRVMTPSTTIERTDHVNDPESRRSADVHGGRNRARRHELRGIRRAEK